MSIVPARRVASSSTARAPRKERTDQHVEHPRTHPARTAIHQQYQWQLHEQGRAAGTVPLRPHIWLPPTPLCPLPLIGCDLHGDGEPIRVGRRVPFAGGVFNQTDVAWNKGVRSAIRESDDRPSYETHLPALEGG